MKRDGGFTIIQIMVVLFIAGIVVWAATETIIDKRCEDNPSAALCASRAGGSRK